MRNQEAVWPSGLLKKTCASRVIRKQLLELRKPQFCPIQHVHGFLLHIVGVCVNRIGTIRSYGNTDLPEGTPDRPLVTFAVFAYNQEKYIREAVEGAFSQTYSPLEIILSDDCSTDRTFEIMEEMACDYRGPHLVKVRQGENNIGLAGHINDVIAASRGEIISWAAGDDIALAQRTAVFVDVLVDDPKLCGVHSDVIEIDLTGRIIRERQHSKIQYETNLAEVIGKGQSVITQSHAFRRIAFDNFGPFKHDLTQEGIAMAFREAALGRVCFVPRSLTLYRIGSGVSTYAGNDAERKRKSEPVKYTKWYLSAFSQMLDDSGKLEEPLPNHMRATLRKNIIFYSNLLKINEGRGIFCPLFENFLIRPKDTKSIRAVGRILFPTSIYAWLIR